MLLNVCLIVILTMNIMMENSQACHQKNISCNDLRLGTTGYFNFQYDCPDRSEIFISNNSKTLIGYGKSGVFNHMDDVVQMKTDSVTTKECRDLEVKCIVDQGQQVNESCWLFKVTGEMETSQTPHTNVKSGESLGVLAQVGIFIIIAMIIIGIIIAIFFWFYNSWKKKISSNRTDSAVGVSPASYIRHLLTRAGCKKGISNEDEHREERFQLNGISSPERCENGQTGTQHNSDAVRADGADPQSVTLDLSDETQMSENGDVGGPGVKKTSHHRAMHRNLREDPGGVNNGDAIHLDMTDTKAALVNGRSFRHGQQVLYCTRH